MVHKNLKAQRQKCGLSQKQVADFLSVSPQSVSKWEKGETLPSIDFLPRLAECLNCDINYFFMKEEIDTTNFTVICSVFALVAGNLRSGTKTAEDIAAYVLENPDAIDMAIQICGDLMEHKTVNVRSIRAMLNCSEAEARTFMEHLECCEMIERLDVDDFFYVIKDAVEGFILLLKIQQQVCDLINKIEQQ